MRLWVFAPFAALVAFAAYLGLRAGQIPSDTEIVNRYVTSYMAVAPDGAVPADCSARSHVSETVRMVIECVHPSGVVTTYVVGPRGEALPEQQGPSA